MRLICPNCDAQYEVPDEVMPETGRDVQCSNCGQTWFQHHPDHAPAEETADRDAFDETHSGPEDPDEEVITAPEPEPEPEPQQKPEQRIRKSLDPDVADILRQEAEHEAQVRRKETPAPMESQPDLGLDDHGATDDAAARRAREARDRMARMRGEEPTTGATDAAATAAAVGSRRDLLPDIEEINSTLRSTSDRTAASAALSEQETAHEETDRKRGFSLGVALAALLTVTLVLLYIYAPELARAAPQVDPWISAYVGKVDQARMWVDSHLASFLTWLDTVASQSEPT